MDALSFDISTIDLNGAQVLPDWSGALYWPDEATLIVADLHFEKGSFFAEKGQFLPPYDSRSTLARLADVCGRLRPARVIALGDSFHDERAEHRIADKDVDTIRHLTKAHEWLWIAGNHDPAPPDHFGGSVVQEVAIGSLAFRHEPLDDGFDGEVAGHFHPCARVRVRGRSMRRRCFMTDGTRMILPAFGAYTGGLDVFDPALQPYFPAQFQVWMLGRGKTYALSKARLRGRRSLTA